jgi:hypothetical protein
VRTPLRRRSPRRPSKRERRPRRALTTTPAPLLAALAATVAIAGCGDTLQDQPIAHNTLEGLLVAPYPVYWLGGSFQGMQITESTHDPSGGFAVNYGDCVEGGESTCVPPLRVVTSPDNSFVAGGSTPQQRAPVRGVQAVFAQRGHTIEIATAGVVVGIYADNAKLAAAAAQTLAPINEVGAPGEPLPARLPDTGFGSTPLPSQTPSPLRALN